MFPSIDNVALYMTEESFKKQRLSSGGWVHYDDLVKNVISGNYERIKPLHIEVCVTYKCNFNCPWCSCRKSMSMFKGVPDLDKHGLETIINECSKHSIGVQWTGGEPLINRNLLPAIEYASVKNVSQCLFTNGSLIKNDDAIRLMDSNLSFVRISLNCVTLDKHSRFHGNLPNELSSNAITGLESLCNAKSALKSKVKIGVSIVVNSVNVDDLDNTYKWLVNLSLEYPAALDYLVIRPVNESIHDIENYFNNLFYEKYSIANESEYLRKLIDEHIQVVFPFTNKCLSNCGKCRGCFLFSEISPDGDMFLCSDRYGDKDYKIGNIHESDFDGIFFGDEKQEVVRRNKNCFSSGRCPANSRGWYFNVLFDQIETLRNKGEMSDVIEWIEELKKTIPNEGNSFFI